MCTGLQGRNRRIFRLQGRGRDCCPGVLGNGFPLDKAKEGQTAFLMGGGIGVPPILELARQLNCEKKIIVGYRDENCFLQSDFEKNGQVFIATEDGSVGTRGNVMDAIRENGLKADVFTPAGPMPMLRADQASMP